MIKPHISGKKKWLLPSSCCQQYLSYVLCQVISHDVPAQSVDLHVADTFTFPVFLQTNFDHVLVHGGGAAPSEAVGQQPACAGAAGEHGTSSFPAQQNTGRHGVEGKGKSGGLCNTAWPLCSSFPLKTLSIWWQVRNDSPLSPPSFKGRSTFPGLQSKSRGSSAKQSLQRPELLQPSTEHPDANQWNHAV